MKKADIRAVSLNLRTARTPEQHNQSIREPRIAAYLAQCRPATLGVQECTPFWRERLDAPLTHLTRLQPPHPDPNGFKNFLYYDPEQVTPLESGVFWLSRTPGIVSRDFGSRYCISCGWGLFEAREGGVRYVHMNTHLDYTCEDTRLDECAVLLPHAHVLAKRGYPVFLTGDFNAPPDSPTHERMLVDGLFRDFRAAVPAPALPWTFNHYLSEEQEPEPADFLIIDYGFYSDGILPQRLTVTDKADGGYLSDHNALCFDMTITNETEEPQT